jgi:hypothetical protein
MGRISHDLDDETLALAGSTTNALGTLHAQRDSSTSIVMPIHSSSNAILLHIVALAGKLGVIVDTPPAGGPPYVCETRTPAPSPTVSNFGG